MDSAQLEFLDGPEAGRLVILRPDAALTIGRVKANDLTLPDSAVSRQHAKIFLRGGVHHLVDLNSSHGSFVNGQQVTRHALREGDELRFGETRLLFRSAASGPTASAVAPAPAPSPAAAAADSEPGDDDGGFQLEMPDELLPTARPPAPPEDAGADPSADEDPFAGEDEAAPAPRVQRAVADASTFGRPDARPGGRASTVRSSAARAAGSAPLLRQDLDQHGGAFRWVAILVVVLLTVGLGWGVMKLVGSTGGDADAEIPEELRPNRPSPPTAPPRRPGR